MDETLDIRKITESQSKSHSNDTRHKQKEHQVADRRTPSNTARFIQVARYALYWRHINVMAYQITFNTLRPRLNGRHFPDDIFKCIFLNENVWISLQISLKFDPEVQINNIPALVEIMAWRRPGDKPLSEAMVVSFTDAYMRHSASMS